MLFERQQYQEDCVSNILSVFQDTDEAHHFSPTALRALHQRDGIQINKIVDMPRLDVLMETGTGKTFTYLKTMYEMNKQFGINKFIVFVPRIAIRAVVVQNIELTADYFFREYGKRIKKHIYGDKSGLSQVHDFVRSENDFSVLILTSASITGKNKNDRILTSRSENLFDAQSPLDAISQLKPVVFIDEPHLLKGDGFMRAYQQYFATSLCLRFGATFPIDNNDVAMANVVYSLDSITSFREYLVKKIRVSTIIDNAANIKFYPTGERKMVDIYYFKNGIEHRRKVSFGDSIAGITGIADYDFSVQKIIGNDVYLSNGTTRQLSDDDYVLTDDSIRRMVRATIKIHFDKEAKLFARNIKTLSLFFIPNIDDFRGKEPRVKVIFDEEYQVQRREILQQEISPAYRNYLNRDYDDAGRLCVREGYFSGDHGSSDAKEAHGVNLILNDKAKLLSTDEPLRFIFSVWALQEGWDNPNVFTICKLAVAKKDVSRRQQVGRGLRLAVDNAGKRQTIKHCRDDDSNFYEVNMLDVVVSGHEKNFIEEIQAEIVGNSIAKHSFTYATLGALGLTMAQRFRLVTFLLDEEAIRGLDDGSESWEIRAPIADCLRNNRDNLPESLVGECDKLIDAFDRAAASPVENRNRPNATVGVRAEKFRQFEELWKTITTKAKLRYGEIDDDALIVDIADAFNRTEIPPMQMRMITKIYDHVNNQIFIDREQTEHMQPLNAHRYAKFITAFAGNENLPLQFCRKLFSALDKNKIQQNQTAANTALSAILKQEIHKTVMQSIGYDFDGEIAISARSVFYQDESCTTPKAEIEANKIGHSYDDQTTPGAHYLYDQLVYDSLIERDVIKNDPPHVNNSKIVVFAKLPRISIPTPYKWYSPDFAYFVENQKGKKLFLVVETKGYNHDIDIPANEQRKIDYAKKFFSALNAQMESVTVVFKRRINRDSLMDLLHNIGNFT